MRSPTHVWVMPMSSTLVKFLMESAGPANVPNDVLVALSVIVIAPPPTLKIAALATTAVANRASANTYLMSPPKAEAVFA